MKNLFKRTFISILLITFFLSPSIDFLSNGKRTALGTTEVSAATSYPTPWYPLNQYSYKTSGKFVKAGRTALVSVGITFIGGRTDIAVKEVCQVVATALLTQYFVNSDSKNIYYTVEYSYRALSKYKVLPNSTTVVGDYQIKKVVRSYSDSARTKLISTKQHIENSSSLTPWF